MLRLPVLILVPLVLVPTLALGQRMSQQEALDFLDAVAQPDDRVMPVAATGSMYPFLDENCLTLVRHEPVQDIQTGDIVVFERNAMLIGHRVVRHRRTEFVTLGDHNPFPDSPVEERKIRGVVVAVASFDPKSPRVRYAPIGFEATNRELRELPETAPFTLSEARRVAKSELHRGEKMVTVRTTGDNVRRSEQCVLVVRETAARIEAGDLVTLKLSLWTRFFRLFKKEKESTARRVASIGPNFVTVYREGRPDDRATVPRSDIEGLVIGCVFFAGRDTNAGESIYLE